MHYEVTNREETVGIVMEQTVTDEKRRPYVDIANEEGEVARSTFVSKRNAFAALGTWIHRYGHVYDDANVYNLRVFEIKSVPSREEVS